MIFLSLCHRHDWYLMATDKRKQSLYFPDYMLKEIKEEADRQDRSYSWMIQRAWEVSRREIMSFTGVNDIAPSVELRENAQSSGNDRPTRRNSWDFPRVDEPDG